MKTDVVIVGGGIGGSVLATLLGRAGKKAVVLERSTGPPAWVRPEILWPRTVQTLSELLPRDAIKQSMVPLRGVSFWKGNGFDPVITEATFAASGVQPWSTNPNLTRELLLESGGFELRRGVEVTGLLTDKGRVRGVRARKIGGREFEIHADWTIGDDGGRSFVRQRLGIELVSRLFPLEFFCFEFKWLRSFDSGCIHVIPNLAGVPGGFAALGGAPLPGRKGVGIMAVFGDRYSGEPTDWSRWLEAYPIAAEFFGRRRLPGDLVHLKRYWGHAASYAVKGAMLMGDAAHPPSPAGGQGANMAIADARALARLLIENRPDIGIEYERLRRPANSRSLRPTRAANLILGFPPWCRSQLPAGFVARQFSGSQTAVGYLLRTLAGSFQSPGDSVG